MRTRTYISILLAFMVNAVLFGSGAIIVLSIEALRVHAVYLLPVVIITALVATPFVSWWLAPRLRVNHHPR